MPAKKIGLFWELYPKRFFSDYFGVPVYALFNDHATDIQSDIGHTGVSSEPFQYPLVWVAKIYVPIGETLDYIGDPDDEQIYEYDWAPDTGYESSAFLFQVWEGTDDGPLTEHVMLVSSMCQFLNAVRGTLTFSVVISGVMYTITAWINTVDGYVGTYSS